ncbi:hypothetical protein AS593_21035 [Caulobacter vibrioides]|nr:hypothetical protein AS593_21035 [Caulobacter vibrioides]
MLPYILAIALMHAGLYGRRLLGGPASILKDLGFLCVTASLLAGAVLVNAGASVAVGLLASICGVIAAAVVIAMGHVRETGG